MVDIIRLLKLEGGWLILYADEEQHLPYWKPVNKKEKVVIVPQTESR